MITQGGIHDEETLNIYTDGSSIPDKKRAAGVGVVLLWVDEAGNPQTCEYAPSGYGSATIDEMGIQACTEPAPLRACAEGTPVAKLSQRTTLALRSMFARLPRESAFEGLRFKCRRMPVKSPEFNRCSYLKIWSMGMESVLDFGIDAVNASSTSKRATN